MSIYDSLEKINPVKDREGSWRPSIFNGVKLFLESEKGKDIFVVIIVILVGLGSFELGRLSKENNSSGIKIEYSNQIENQTASPILFENSVNNAIFPKMQNSNSTGKNFFASNRGSKYYSLGCSAGKTIKQENRVYFATGEEAEAAGYTLSNSCD